MLSHLKKANMQSLFDSIPDSLRLNRPLNIPPALSELELTEHLTSLANQNDSCDQTICFLGGGAYDHFIPATVDAIGARSEYYTSYTPYQAEASQGSLQAFFEYQTLISQLTGMEVSNASLYDGGTATTEAAIMAMGATRRHGRIVVSESLHPEYREILRTYLHNLETEIVTVPAMEGVLDVDVLKDAVNEDTACVIVQHPNFFGCLEDVDRICDITHDAGALFTAVVDPISLGILRRPGDYGADIAVAEGQCLGNPLQFGGPYLGILACKEQFVRKMPGRIVGQTTDRNGRSCYVLTLQTREQHIRREKATSNICTNQGLLALRSAVYLATLGKTGLAELGELCTRKAHFLAGQISEIPGFRMKFKAPFFKEFLVECEHDVPDLLQHCKGNGIFAGIPIGRWFPKWNACFLTAVTEKRTRSDMEKLQESFASF